MSHVPKATLVGMNQFYDDLFINLSLPEGVSNETFVNTLLMKYGEFPVIYPNPDFLKWYIGAWSVKWASDLSKIVQAMLDKYNPLHNFDRYEEYTDNEDTNNSLQSSGTTEEQVSAYNANTYQPDQKQINSGNSTGAEDRTLEHSGHLYGNIGVTTSQQMLTAEIELRTKYNLYELLTGILAKEICVLIY